MVENTLTTLKIENAGNIDLVSIGLMEHHQANKDILALKRGEAIDGSCLTLKPNAPVVALPSLSLFSTSATVHRVISDASLGTLL